MANESDYPAKYALEDGSGFILLETGSDYLIKETQNYPELVLTDGAICYFRFNESSGNFTDSVGGRTATAVGSIAYSQTGALVGDTDTGIGISDTTMYATLPGSASLTPKGNSNNLTVEAWASFAASGASNRTLIAFGGGFAEWTFEMTRNTANTMTTFTTGTDSANGSLWNVQQSVSCDSLRFNHFVFVADGSAAHTRVYVNGVLVPSADQAWTGTGVPKTWVSNNLVIGLDLIGGTDTLNGVLDELAIYPTALTADQIARHYYCGLQYLPIIPPPVQLAAH